MLRRTDDPELIGLAGETFAARTLCRRGWRLLARRLRTSAAEVDLLFLEGRELVCVEVKTGRRGPRFRPGMRVDARRLDRLWEAARLLGRRYGRKARVDVAEVLTGTEIEVVAWRELRHPL